MSSIKKEKTVLKLVNRKTRNRLGQMASSCFSSFSYDKETRWDLYDLLRLLSWGVVRLDRISYSQIVLYWSWKMIAQLRSVIIDMLYSIASSWSFQKSLPIDWPQYSQTQLMNIMKLASFWEGLLHGELGLSVGSIKLKGFCTILALLHGELGMSVGSTKLKGFCNILALMDGDLAKISQSTSSYEWKSWQKNCVQERSTTGRPSLFYVVNIGGRWFK